MKKGFKFYAASWAALAALFNAICFITPSELFGISKYDGAFWIGYLGIMAAFIGQLVCAGITFKAENSRKFFYNLPLITISYTMLVLTIVVGTMCIIIPGLPNWIGAVFCLIIFALSAVSIIKASAAAGIVGSVDEKIKEQTQFIKNLAADAENLLYTAKSDIGKAESKKIYEAIRYSDPMSNDMLQAIEAEIKAEFKSFSDAVNSENDDITQVVSNKLNALITERNSKCKLKK